MWLYAVLTTLCYTLVTATTITVLTYQLQKLHNIERKLDMSQEAIDAITAQLAKVETEVVDTRDNLLAEIKDLKDQIANGVPAPELDLAGLTAVAQRLDDLTPDPVDPDFGVDHPENVDPNFGVETGD